MWPIPRIPVDLVTFTEEILNGKLHFLCSDKLEWYSPCYCNWCTHFGYYLWVLIISWFQFLCMRKKRTCSWIDFCCHIRRTVLEGLPDTWRCYTVIWEKSVYHRSFTNVGIRTEKGQEPHWLQKKIS